MKKLFLALVFAGILTGCQMGYVPSTVNTPMFEKEKQFSASATVLSTLDFQAAYSITSKYYIFGDINYLLPDDEGNEAASFSGGLGYYENFDDNSLFEIALGAGAGYGDDYYSKFFVQPTLAWRLRNGELGLTMKAVMINYPEIQDSPGLYYSASDVFFEPVATFRIGKNRAKMQFQIGPSIPVVYNSDFSVYPFVASMGLNFRI